jgi:two-component system response regulator NreC
LNSVPTVLLVDDHPLFRLGVETLLAREPDLEVVATASCVAEAVELAEQLKPDVIVCDVLLPVESGIGLTRRLLSDRPMRILGLSVLDEPIRIAEMMRAGAIGFALKIQTAEEIVEAIRETAAGRRYLAPAIRDQVEQLTSNALPLERLTNREREVFGFLVKGESNAEIGERLGIAVRTVDTHRQRVLKKLDAHSIADLVRFAARWGAFA